MSGLPLPPDSFLRDLEVVQVQHNRRIWRGENGFFYTWDSLHGEVEVFNERGRHLGACDAISGVYIKDPVKGRRIDV